MEDDEIEILDIFDKDKKEKKEDIPSTPVTRVSRLEREEEPVVVKKTIPNSTPKKTKKKVKAGAFQKLFCICSAIFLLGCIVFYGYRFIKYYRIYNPKVDSGDGSVLLAKDIVGKSEFATDEEDGLFSSSGNYIYKGAVTNNYLKFNNMLWRIVRINADNSIDIILDDYTTLLPWNSSVTEFKKADIYEYLNKDFLSLLDQDMLVKTSFCTDKIDSLSSITCEDQEMDGYVKLLDVANFLNSVNKSKSYLVKEEEIFWLSDYGTDKIWHTNGVNVSQSEVGIFYEIRPMVRLKSTTVYSSGEGTMEKPFTVDKEDILRVGSKVKLGEDTWIVYDNTSDIKLMLEKTLDKQVEYDSEKLTYSDSSIMKYLNDTYLNSLSYKDMLVETTWYTGGYKTSINDIKGDTVKAKVGIPNLLDIKFNSEVSGYFTSTSQEDRILVYENPLRPGKVTTYRSVRPCIAISKESANKLKYADGLFKVGE